jgi:hypothetical protein
LATVAGSSAAKYLDQQHLRNTTYPTIKEALATLVAGTSDAVVNSVGTLEYAIATDFSGVIPMPNGTLAPAYMAFALPPSSPLKKPLDRALIKITASAAWRSLEPSYFGRQARIRGAGLFRLQLPGILQDDLELALVELDRTGDLDRLAGEPTDLREFAGVVRQDHAGEGVVGILAAHIQEGHPRTRAVDVFNRPLDRDRLPDMGGGLGGRDRIGQRRGGGQERGGED